MRGRAIACLWIGLCGCQRLNPAFDDVDELSADEADSSEGIATSGSDSHEENEGESSVGTEAETAESSEAETEGESESESEGETETTDPTADTDEPCPDETLCDGVCIDTESDPLNCGDCNTPCMDGQLCGGGDCVAAKRVFVTSIPHFFNADGVASADAFCNTIAGSAGLQGNFKAWLSTPNNSPKLDFTKGSGYVRTDGALIATSWLDLIDGVHPNPIDTDEYGGPLPGIAACGFGSTAWSGTDFEGNPTGQPNCSNWTTSTVASEGQMGDVLAMDETWSDVGDCTVPCSTPLPIYCFEQ